MTETQLFLLDHLGTTGFTIAYAVTLLFTAFCSFLLVNAILKLFDLIIKRKGFSKKDLYFILKIINHDLEDIDERLYDLSLEFSEDTLIQDEEYCFLTDESIKYNKLRNKIENILGDNNGFKH